MGTVNLDLCVQCNCGETFDAQHDEVAASVELLGLPASYIEQSGLVLGAMAACAAKHVASEGPDHVVTIAQNPTGEELAA